MNRLSVLNKLVEEVFTNSISERLFIISLVVFY